jgi:ABC-type bacteriocin/lantibiotic exporter with double-glycine peptidase domain
LENETTEKKLNFLSKLEIKNLSFRYNENLPKILNNVSLTINKGEKITIKGQTGSGKSTLVNIISGLLDPLEGKIIVDDKEINSLNKISWQKNFAIVPQTVFLSDSSILENIAIGYELDEINLEKAKQVAKIAQIDSFIEKLPNQYLEKVGERGVRLSGGQRQRIGIARALYRDASIIILDEPTNALDKETEKLVMDSISNLGKDITLIMISHSNNLLQYFDQVIDLDKIK